MRNDSNLLNNSPKVPVKQNEVVGQMKKSGYKLLTKLKILFKYQNL